MTTKTKKPAGKKTSKKAAPKKAPKPKIGATPVADPCAKGHKWDKDAEGVEHCTACLADRKVIEKPSKLKVAKAKSTEAKLSAFAAAAKVIAGSVEPLNTKQMIEQISAKKLWTSPGGKTPNATLYSALLKEIQPKGREARFKKTERGHFAVNGQDRFIPIQRPTIVRVAFCRWWAATTGIEFRWLRRGHLKTSLSLCRIICCWWRFMAHVLSPIRTIPE